MPETPVEILQLISQHLSMEDRYACLGVSRLWCAAFATSVLDTLQLKDGTALLKLLTHCGEWVGGSAPAPLLTYVHHVKLQLDEAEWQRVNDLKLLLRLCTHLRSLDVRFHWSPSLPHYTREKISPLLAAAVPRKMACLTRLHLDIPLMDRDTVKSAILSQLPNLTHLHLDWIAPCWTTHDMTCAHALCPNLESIYIAATTFPGPNDHTFDEKNMPAKAKRVRSFRFHSGRGLHHQTLTWLKYATQNYHTTLEEFCLNGVARDPPNRPIWFEAVGYGAQRGFQDDQFDADDPAAQTAVFDKFKKTCKNLHSLEIDCHDLTHILFRRRHLVPGLRHLGLNLRDVTFLLRNYSVYLVDPAITSLTLWCSLRAFDKVSYILHRGVPNLTRLDLICDTDVELDTILSACPHLTDLVLQCARPLTWESVWWRPHPALRKLVLSRCLLKEGLMGYVSRQCTQLQQLTLDHCRFLLSESRVRHTWLQLDLTGFTRLTCIRLCEPVLWHCQTGARPWPSLCDFVGIDNYRNSQGHILWYNTRYHSHVPPAYSYPSEHILGQRPLRDIASASIVKDVLSRKPYNGSTYPYFVLLVTCRRDSDVIYRVNDRRLLLK